MSKRFYQVLSFLSLLMLVGGLYYFLSTRQEVDIKEEYSSRDFKIYTLRADVYGVDSYVVITQDTNKAVRFIREVTKDFSVNNSTLQAEGVTFRNEKGPDMIWLPHVPKTPYDYGVANHELFHLTTNIMLYVGVPLSDSSEEAWAYMFSHLSTQFYEQAK